MPVMSEMDAWLQSRHEKVNASANPLTPGQFFMKRVVDYLLELSTVYGCEDSVHFDWVDTGSAQLKSFVEEKAYPLMKIEVRRVSGGLGKS